MARWLNWLERPVHTREVESSSLSLATLVLIHENQDFFYYYAAVEKRLWYMILYKVVLRLGRIVIFFWQRP